MPARRPASPGERSLYARIYAAVRRVPPGRVTTYGEIARLVGRHDGARTVGWALASLPDDRTAPWWRVIRGDGTVAPRPGAGEQRRRLAREGVRFRRGVLDLARYGWRPLTARTRLRRGGRGAVDVARRGPHDHRAQGAHDSADDDRRRRAQGLGE